MSDYPRFQYSYFLPNGAQIVVREDEYDTFKDWVDGVLVDFPTSGAKQTSIPTTAPQNVNVENVSTKTCTIHNIEMKEKVSKTSGKPYFAHYKKVGETWDTCFGRGWMSEIDNAQEIANKLNNNE